MKHTYLLREATWEATGFFVDAEGRKWPATGRAVITHQPDAWHNDGSMTVHLEEPLTFENHYVYSPFETGQLEARWRSSNPAMGELEGDLAIVGDSLLFRFDSPDGVHRGTEYLKKISDDHYLSRGAYFSGVERVSSWAVDLKRV